MERLLTQPASVLADFSTLAGLLSQASRLTRRKFSVEIVSIRGAFSHVEICAEGPQKEGENVLPGQKLFNAVGHLSENLFDIYYCYEQGVVVTWHTD